MTNSSTENAAQRAAKILFLIDELNVGGTEKQLIWLCEKMPRDRFSPTIGVLRQTAYQENLALDTPIVSFNWRGLPIIKNFKLVGRLRRYLKRENFDIVQTQFVESEIYGTLAALALGKKPILVSTRRNLYHWIKDDPWRFKIGCYLTRKVDHVLVNSYAVEKKCRELEAVAQNKITVIQNAVALELFSHKDGRQAKEDLKFRAEDYVVGLIGNWRTVKGIANFLAAAKIIAKAIPSARFVLAGQGPLEQELRDFSMKQGVAHRILFINNPTDVPGIIAAMDVAVQSSLSESFSNVILEYMAARKPIVATGVGDTPLMIADGETGLLVAPGEPEEMAEAVIRLHRDQKWAQEMGRLAYATVLKKWSEDEIHSQYMTFYKNVLNCECTS